jgi:phosphoserine aminotransferase
MNQLRNNRAHYFGAGPAAIALPVLEKAQAELLNWQHSGVSILEHSHRTPAFSELLYKLDANLRSLLKIPKSYKIIFTGGNTRSLFGTIPMNLYSRNSSAAYKISGVWSNMAFNSCVEKDYIYKYANKILPGTKFLYYTPNETVNGIYTSKANLPDVPWFIADMTSCLCMEPIEFEKYGVIFAGTQKNLGAAGMQVIIIHEDLLGNINNQYLPSAFNLKILSDANSLFATPPTFNCYLANLVLEWMKDFGDIHYWQQQNLYKANLIYSEIDSSKTFYCPVEHDTRSTINVCFRAHKPELEEIFLAEAKVNNLIGLKGHSTTGGLRATLYNAVSKDAVIKLIEFMHDFSKKHG